ncbi:MAG: glycoside hydrolase family 99-like domain-containing protein [Undibacterium sp.]|nr:glycoside hydrolase family 99-like domain-containing protein [Undibacterium sp.]
MPGIEESLSKITGMVSINSVVLDIGCSSGMLGRYLAHQKGCVIDGIDIDDGALENCHPIYRKVIIKNLESDDLISDLIAESYDFIVVADVIEHLNHPENLLSQLRLLIKPHGTIIFSVPNITHIAASLELLSGRFNYAPNGLLDNTHLRFYSYQNLIKKLENSGLYLWAVETVHRDLTETEFGDAQVNLFPRQWLDTLIASRPDSLVYQWIVSTKIYPSLKKVSEVFQQKRRSISPIFTTALYWENELDSGFNEDNKLPGFKTDIANNEVEIVFPLPFSEAESITRFRIDPASEVKSIWIKSAEIVDSQHVVLWRWSGQESLNDLINAHWVDLMPAEGKIFCSANNDPQWYPQIPLVTLQKIEPGTKFVMRLCDHPATIDAQLEDGLRKQKREAQAEFQKRDEENRALVNVVDERETKINDLQQSIAEQNQQVKSLLQSIAQRDAHIHSILTSSSWVITKPFRYARRQLGGGIFASLSRLALRVVRFIWVIFPLPRNLKGKLKGSLLTNFPSMFRSYRNWVSTHASDENLKNYVATISDTSGYQPDDETAVYVPLLQAQPLANKPVKIICFYLPQFHSIPENDAWWGKDFTEWTNVRPAQAQFENHYQPHEPGELGYYNLLDTATQRRQIELAKLYGVEGFCFYFYWFGGKRLLETPIKNYLNDSTLDLPFCLCWANENWSRRWDGLDHEMLIAQQHSPEDDLAFIEHVAQYMRDARYIRIDGKPLLIVYRPGLLPHPKETVARWRTWCRESGMGEIYLAYTQSFESLDPAIYDFDAAIEFPPNNSAPTDVTRQVAPLGEDFKCTIYDATVFTARSEHYTRPAYKLFRSVFPSWDNTARRKNKSTVFLNSSPSLYQRWLENAIRDTVRSQPNPDERLVFVNAWNEWAEGAHLEPDAKYGYAYLQSTRDAITRANSSQSKSLLIVTHDCHPHGAQFLILETARTLKECGFNVSILALDDGRLLDEFNKIAPTFNGKKAGAKGVHDYLVALNASGTVDAITSTVICGSILPLLKRSGFQVLSLIHEMPGIIREMKQEGNAKSIATLADKIVFPAEMVHQLFNEIAPVSEEKVVIRAQGVLRKNPFKNRKIEAHREICQQYSLTEDTKIVLCIGYMDMRKGIDFFIDVAANVCRQSLQTVFIWVGHAEISLEQTMRAKVDALGLKDKVIFAGFVRDPMAYYAAASVYALTSREDPFPNVVLESAEVGVPVVGFQGASGTGEFIIAQGGHLAEQFNINEFSQHVHDLLTQPPVQTKQSVASLRQYAIDLVHHLNGFPRVSVVVPNFNYARYIHQRLDSVSGQNFPIYELIVLDDVSTDNSVAVIEEFLEHSNIDSQLIINEQNSGSVFRQWKKGSALSKGDLLWIAEADDYADKQFLSSLIPAFCDPSVVLAYCQSKQMNEDGTVIANNYLNYTQDISSRWEKSYLRHGRQEIADSLCIKNTIPNVSAVLFNRLSLTQALSDIGDDLYNYSVAGDWLIYLQVLSKGKVYFNENSLNEHRRHTQSVTHSLNANNHLQEVIDLQNVARTIIAPDKTSALKASVYIQYLHKHFDIPFKEEQNFS